MLFAKTRWALSIWPVLSWIICALYLVSLLDKTAMELGTLPHNLTIHSVFQDTKVSEYCSGLWACGEKLCSLSNSPNLTHLHIYPGTNCTSGISTLNRLYPLISSIFLLASVIFEIMFIMIFLIVKYPEYKIKRWLVFFVIIIGFSISLAHLFQIIWSNQIRIQNMDKIPASVQIFDIMCTLVILLNLYISHYSLLTKDKWVIDPL